MSKSIMWRQRKVMQSCHADWNCYQKVTKYKAWHLIFWTINKNFKNIKKSHKLAKIKTISSGKKHILSNQHLAPKMQLFTRLLAFLSSPGGEYIIILRENGSSRRVKYYNFSNISHNIRCLAEKTLCHRSWLMKLNIIYIKKITIVYNRIRWFIKY